MDITKIKLSDLKKEDSTYENIMSYLIVKGYEIFFLHNDVRGDDGDDGGFVISISRREGKFFVHVLTANYNATLETLVMTEDDPRIDKDSPDFQEVAFPDFVKVDTFDQAKDWIKEFVEKLDEFTLLEDFDGRDAQEFIDYDNRIPVQTAHFLATCFFPYSEYPNSNREALLNAQENG